VKLIENKLILAYLVDDLTYYDFGVESCDDLRSERQDGPEA